MLLPGDGLSIGFIGFVGLIGLGLLWDFFNDFSSGWLEACGSVSLSLFWGDDDLSSSLLFASSLFLLSWDVFFFLESLPFFESFASCFFSFLSYFLPSFLAIFFSYLSFFSLFLWSLWSLCSFWSSSYPLCGFLSALCSLGFSIYSLCSFCLWLCLSSESLSFFLVFLICF